MNLNPLFCDAYYYPLCIGDDAMRSKTYERPPDDVTPTIPTEEWINWYKNNIYLKIINHEYMVRAITNANNDNDNVVNATKRPALGNFLYDNQRIKGKKRMMKLDINLHHIKMLILIWYAYNRVRKFINYST